MDCNREIICKHNKKRTFCKECGGDAICEHNKRRYFCKECGGNGICEHGRRKYFCKDCKGRQICVHDRIRSQCKECHGGGICVHENRRCVCYICNPIGYLAAVVRGRIHQALENDKQNHSLEYLGCTIEEFRLHIESQFKEGMNWDNHGEWHIDHIIPIKYQHPTMEEVVDRLHWTNTQPLWASENISKGNHWIG